MSDLANVQIRFDAHEVLDTKFMIDTLTKSVMQSQAELENFRKDADLLGRTLGNLNRVSLPVVGQMSRLRGEINRSTESFSRGSQAIQQFGYQAGDFFVQIQSGTNAWVAFGQQATQLAGLLFLVNAQWAIMAGAAASILIPLATAFGGYLSRTREAVDATKGFDDALKGLNDSIKSLEDGYLKQFYLVSSQEEVESIREILRLQQEGKALRQEIIELEASGLSANMLTATSKREELSTMLEQIAALKTRQEQLAAYRTQLETAANINSQMLAVELGHARAAGNLERDRLAKAQAYHNQMLAVQGAHNEVNRILEVIKDRIGDAQVSAQTLASINFSNLNAASDAALRIAANLGIALTTAMSLAALGPQGIGGNDPSGGTYSGRGRGPTDGELAEMRANGVRGLGASSILPGVGSGGGGGGGGGGGTNPLIAELESLQDFLRTEAELEIESYTERQETLRSALDQKLLTLQEYNQLEKELKMKHDEEMAQLDAYRYGNGLAVTKQWFGDMANAFQSGGERMARIGRVLNAAIALQNSYVAFTEVLKDPAFIGRPFARFAAASAILAQGLSAVAAIRGSSGGSGGSGGGSVGSIQSTRQATAQTVYISGLAPDALFTGEMLQELFNSFYKENDNRGKVFVVAR